MIDKIYLDASFFIAFKIPSHPFYKKALKIFDQIKNQQIYFSLFFIDEVIYNLSKYKLNKKQITDLVKKDLLEANNTFLLTLPPQKKIIEKYLKQWQKYNLKPIDSVHLFLMKQHKIKTIATFDNHFIKNKKQLGINIL